MNRFSFPKVTGTHADIFAAVGLADLISPLSKCSLIDSVTGYTVETAEELSAADLDDIAASVGYSYLRPNEKATVPELAKRGDVLDYPQEKARADRFRSARETARNSGTEFSGDIAADAPRPDWRLYQALNALQGDDATNKVALAILDEPEGSLKQIITNGITQLGTGKAPVADWPVTLVQLFNPHAAKGYARLKPDSTDRNDQSKNSWAEPFIEWLKYRGYFRVACPFFLGTKGENIRLFCPVPEKIDAQIFQMVVAELRASRLAGSVPKLDCLASLTLARILILRSREFLHGLTPAQLISGIMIVQYQSMGQSKAVTNMDRVALPDWFPIHSQEDADLWIDILEEHRAVVRSLLDDRSDEIGLLLRYRKYLEKRDKKSVLSLLSFMEEYGIFLIRQRARDAKRRLQQFQSKHLERILMQDRDYGEVLSNPGFRAIAGAIRSATVSAQSMKRIGRKDYREIRYDLLPELRRKHSLPGVAPFLQAIADFLATYNAESARRYELERSSGTRRITTEELDSFVELLSTRKDASVIGAMLCAYASCREPKEPEVDGKVEPEEDNRGTN